MDIKKPGASTGLKPIGLPLIDCHEICNQFIDTDEAVVIFYLLPHFDKHDTLTWTCGHWPDRAMLEYPDRAILKLTDRAMLKYTDV